MHDEEGTRIEFYNTLWEESETNKNSWGQD
nr:MAG TPA: hypothetical protein [Caudoviricetes sp.]